MNIQLTDERIDAMRDRVLTDVEADVARRGRTLRKGVAGGFGALALVTVLGVAGPGLLGGPADPVAHQATSAGGAAERMPAPNSLTGETAQLDSAYSAKDAAPIDPPAEPLTAPGKDREVITTGSATVKVRDAADEATTFTRWVEKRGGRVDARSESRDGGVASASVTARIPSSQVNPAIAQLRRQGEVETVNLSRDDVTAQGADLDGRIKALTISIERLENILARAGSSSEVIEAETALSDRQQELESLKLQRRSLNDQVALSSLTVDFVQLDRPGSVAPGGFRGGLVAGWNALVDTFNAVVTAAGAVLPWLGVAVVGAVAWWVVRRTRRRRS